MKIHKNEKKLILYELNEVPKRLIEKYAQLKPNSSFAYLLKKGNLTETYTSDIGELHPWSTWPTLHRGVNNKYHKINFINQPLEDANTYPPIWDLLQKKGFKVGVFGSLQSYPPINSENISFYLPDTFAPDSDAYPEILRKFQSFNLKVCAENKAISKEIGKYLYLDFCKLIFNGAFSISSLSKIFLHILKEKINTQYCKRRSLFQPTLGFDLYFKCLNKYQPNFSTFFTNHVAGIIHRYWRDLFPEDFTDKSYKISNFKKYSVIKAMDISDKQICRLIKYCNKFDANLLIASSMSQKAVRDVYMHWDLQFEDFLKFLKFFKLDKSKYILKPAMQPDHCIKCSSINDLLNIKKIISKIKDNEGNLIIHETYRRDNHINISLHLTRNLMLKNFLEIDNCNYSLSDIGLKMIKRDPGTAYHTPEGILIKYGRYFKESQFIEQDLIDTTQIAPMISNYFGI